MTNKCIFVESIIFQSFSDSDYKQHVEGYLSDLKDWCLVHSTERAIEDTDRCVKGLL